MQHGFEGFRQFVNGLEKEARAMAKRQGVEYLAGPQGFTLFYLLKHSDREIFVSDIERKAKISKSVASGLVKRMEKNGYIQVLPSQDDKRKKQILLTEEGREAAHAFGRFIRDFHEQLFEGLTKEDIETAIRVWRRMEENIKQGGKDA